MKQPKKLTRAQKNLVDKCGLFPTDWMCLYEDNDYLHIISKGNPGEIKIIDKNRKALCGKED